MKLSTHLHPNARIHHNRDSTKIIPNADPAHFKRHPSKDRFIDKSLKH